MSRLDFCKYELVDDCYDWKNDNCDGCNIFRAYCEGARRAKNSIMRCKDCRWWQDDYMGTWCGRLSGVRRTNADDFCSWGERRSNRGEEVNGFKSVGQACNTSQERREP